jgi:DNA repair ATPase RecN
MSRRNRTLLIGLGAAALAAVGATTFIMTRPRSAPEPAPAAAADEAAAERLARARREVAHLRNLTRQYRWGIGNLQHNQSFVQVELERLRAERRLMPDDDPARETLERRLTELPDLYRDYVDNEARARDMLAEIEAELKAKEAALQAIEATTAH